MLISAEFHESRIKKSKKEAQSIRLGSFWDVAVHTSFYLRLPEFFPYINS